MAITPVRIGDVIVPSVFAPYVREQTTAKSALWTSGIVQNLPGVDGLMEGGNVITLPFWKDLTGNSQVLSANGVALNVNKIQTGTDKAVTFARGNAWGANELAGALAGSDPMAAIGDAVARWWARDMQTTLLSMLAGLFGTAGALTSTHLLDISAVSNGQMVTAISFLDALQKLGDASDQLTAVAMHSATANALAKQDIIEFQPTSEQDGRIATFMNRRVIIDDSMPVSSGVYDTYLFGAGSIGFVEGNGRITEVETDRDSLAGEDYLINRRFFILHPRGVKWAGTDPTEGGPTNTDLSTPANWSRVVESKSVRIVCLRHRLANAA